MQRNKQHGEHFWVASYPFFDTSLIITPPHRETDSAWSEIDVYDCDGAKVNNVISSFEPGTVGSLQLDSLMGSCKLESGFKVAHVVARPLLPGVKHQCRLISHEHACLMGSSFTVFPNVPAFFPVSFLPGKKSFITVVNFGDTEASIKMRLFFGIRTPEILCELPPMGARIIPLEGEFAECAEKATERTMQAYSRITTKSEAGLGVQLLENFKGIKEANLFYSLA